MFEIPYIHPLNQFGDLLTLSYKITFKVVMCILISNQLISDFDLCHF